MVRIAALICAVLIYIPLFNFRPADNFICLLKRSEIDCISGTAVSNPVRSSFMGGTYRIVLECERAFSGTCSSACSGTITAYIPSSIVESLYPGKIYSLPADYKSHLISQGAKLTLNINRKKQFPDNVFLVTSAECEGFEGGLTGKILKVRALSRLNFKRLMYNWGEAGGFLLALLTGSREYTQKEVSESFVNSGLAHIIALSGMHLSMFGALALLFGRKITGRKVSGIIQTSAILFFVWFAGLSPSLFRALICALIYLLSDFLRIKRAEPVDALCMTFLIHTVCFPEHLFEASFLLSYFALAGILIITPQIKRFFSPRFFPCISNSLCQGTGAQVMTAPVSIAFFGKIMPGGIISSVFVTPAVMIFLYCGLFGVLICMLMPFLSPVFNAIINVIYCVIKGMVFFFAKIPAVTF